MHTKEMFFLVLGIVFTLYGLCIYVLHSGTWFFAVWLCLGLVCLGAAFVVRKGLWLLFPAILRHIITGGTVLFLILTLVTQILVCTGFSSGMDKELDYLVVLGAQVRANGPAKVTRYRLDTAIAYLNEHPDTQVVVSGGQGSNEPMPEGDAMAAYLIERGIAEERILIENKSTNTIENLTYSKELIDVSSRSIGIVTNQFHMYRALLLAKHCGYTDVYGVPAPSDAFYLPNNMFRETFALVKDFLVGNLS